MLSFGFPDSFFCAQRGRWGGGHSSGEKGTMPYLFICVSPGRICQAGDLDSHTDVCASPCITFILSFVCSYSPYTFVPSGPISVHVCMLEEEVRKHTHTRTHICIYMYIHIYTYVCACVLIHSLCVRFVVAVRCDYCARASLFLFSPFRHRQGQDKKGKQGEEQGSGTKWKTSK